MKDDDPSTISPQHKHSTKNKGNECLFLFCTDQKTVGILCLEVIF